MRNCPDSSCVCNSICVSLDRAALGWHIPASPLSLVGVCGVSVQLRRFCFSLLPHLSLLTAMESSSVFRHIHRLHYSLFRRFDSPDECVCVCLAVLCVWICVGHLSAVRKGLDLCGCLCIKLPSHHTRRTQRPFCSKNVSQFPFARTWRDRCKRLEAASGIGGG